MKKKRIGRSDLLVSPLAFGGNVFGWTIDENQSFLLLDRFLEAGFNFIDTADVYSRWAGKGGESETIIGKWMKARKNRHKVILATKAGMDVGEGAGLKKNYVLRAAEASLQRLQTDSIDLYQSHKDDLSTPVTDPLEAYATLKEQGKIKFIGASNFTPTRLQEALKASASNNLPRYECLQPHYNLCERKLFEGETEAICLREELGVIPYYSLASGFLTGKYRSSEDAGKSVRGRGATKYLNERGKNILAALDEVSAAHACNPASVAIAWLLSRTPITAPIASATSISQLEDLFKGATMTLSEQESELLDNVSS